MEVLRSRPAILAEKLKQLDFYTSISILLDSLTRPTLVCSLKVYRISNEYLNLRINIKIFTLLNYLLYVNIIIIYFSIF
jgi:hypothetical protein